MAGDDVLGALHERAQALERAARTRSTAPPSPQRGDLDRREVVAGDEHARPARPARPCRRRCARRRGAARARARRSRSGPGTGSACSEPSASGPRALDVELFVEGAQLALGRARARRAGARRCSRRSRARRRGRRARPSRWSQSPCVASRPLGVGEAGLLEQRRAAARARRAGPASRSRTSPPRAPACRRSGASGGRHAAAHDHAVDLQDGAGDDEHVAVQRDGSHRPPRLRRRRAAWRPL